MKAIDEVMTLMEAKKRWQVPESTLRNYASGYRRADGKEVLPIFNEDECRKSAGTFLVTRQGMQRIFGDAPGEMEVWEQSSLFE